MSEEPMTALEGGDSDERFLLRAVELARRGVDAGEGGPFGAVIVREGVVVGEGWNRTVGDNDPTAHAEIVAIRDACARLGSFRLDGCTIYASGEPCPMCLAALYWSRIDRIAYATTHVEAAEIGFDDREIARELCRPPGERSIPEALRPLAEGRALFRDYAASPRKVRY